MSHSGLDIKNNYSLVEHNTFAIECRAETFISVSSVIQLRQIIQRYADESVLVLGGGSNILFDEIDVKRPVLWINLKGIEQLETQDEHVIIKAMAGENWHKFVLWCLQQDYGGLENLSLIPGSVGAVPVQNIGAYGVEIKERLVQVEAMNLQDGSIRHFSVEECGLGYRDSIFKNAECGQWVIISVSFCLSYRHHQLKLDYGVIQETLQAAGIENPGIKDVSNAVLKIRQQRLPDPKTLPNAGSFFKNPVIDATAFRAIQSDHPDIPFFDLPDQQVKVPAGWLIEQCGWKGQRRGGCAVHDQHALVLINDGGASGAEVLALAKEIQASVKRRFGITLFFEVNISSINGALS